MASGPEWRATGMGAEKYAYDFNYVPPLALAKSVPGLGFSLEWALLVAATALRIFCASTAEKTPELAA